MTRILYVADVNGWAYWHVGQGLKRYAPEGVNVSVIDNSTFGAIAQELTFAIGEFEAVIQASWMEASYHVSVRKHIGLLGSHGIEWTYPGNEGDYQQRIVTKLRNRKEASGRLPQFQNVLCFNRRLYEAASELKGVNAVYCLPGVDDALFTPGDKRQFNQLRVGWCAQDGRTKGHDEVLVPLQNRMGNCVYWNVLRRNAQTALSHKDMATWHRENDVYLSTSFSEGCQNTIMEAMACGVPVIATSAGAAPECIGDTGVVLPNYSNDYEARETVDRMEQALTDLCENRSVVRTLGDLARQRVESELSWAHRAPVWCREILE